MIDAIKLNIKSFSKKKTFKNYLMINIFLFLFFSLILIIRNFCIEQINSVVNDESNRIINVNDYGTLENFLQFVDANSEDIDNIYYDVNIYDFIIDNKNYFITSSEIYTEEKNVKVNSKFPKNKITIYDLTLDNIDYDDSLEEDVILINQSVAKYLFYNSYVENSFISFKIKDYYNINKIFSSLNAYNIDANLNTDSSDSLSVYMNINTILKILFIFLIFIVIIVNLFLTITFLYEQKNNIKIYNSIGFNIINIIIIYLCNFIYYIFISYLFTTFIIFFVLLILLAIGYDFIIYFYSILLNPILVFIILNIFITSSCVLFILKKDA